MPANAKKPLSNRCPRCDGLLVPEAIAWAHTQWYCLNCGHRTCPTIRLNRLLHPPPSYDKAQPRRYPVCLIA